MPESGYEEFKTKILAMTRIDLNLYKERQMKRRIDALILKHGLTTYDEFVNELKTNKEIYDDFLSYLTINVSEFFRNPDQWQMLEKEIIPELLKKTSTLKIWSAACSTGDEPYSLAMMLLKRLPASQFKIIATDIDKQILEKARNGIYSSKSVKEVPSELLSKHFTKLNENAYQINDDVKRSIRFEEHNLLRDTYPKDFDLILCRNVVIYFTEEAKEHVYKEFHNSLKEHGVLFVGSTEQIIQPSSVGFVPFRAFFYKRI